MNQHSDRIESNAHVQHYTMHPHWQAHAERFTNFVQILNTKNLKMFLQLNSKIKQVQFGADRILPLVVCWTTFGE